MDKVIIFAPVALGIGISIYFHLPYEPSLQSVLIISVALLVLAVAAITKAQNDLRRVSGILLIFLVSGVVSAQLRTHSVAAPVLPEGQSGKHSYQGRVAEIEHFDSGDRITLENVNLTALKKNQTPARIRIKTRLSGTLSVGNIIYGDAVLRPPPLPSAPGVYDFARRAWFMQIGAVGFSLGAPKIRPALGQIGVMDAFGLSIDQLRDRLGQALYQASEDKEAGGLAVALAIGDRSRIDEDMREKLRAAGLAHLLAISGLHMMLVVVFLFSGMRALLAAVETVALRYPIKKWAAVFAIIGAFGYLLLAGMTIPTQRAFLMASIAMIAVVIDRSPISLRLVAFAAIVILLLRPESLLSPSFQLSFSAVTALVSVYECRPVQRLNQFMKQNLLLRGTGYFLFLSLTTVVASAATTPLVWHHFGQFAPFGLLGNLLAIPIMGLVVMPLLIVNVAAAILLPEVIISILGLPMFEALSGIIAIAEWVAGLDGAYIRLIPMHLVPLLVTMLGGLMLCLLRDHIRIAGLVLIISGIFAAPLFPPPDILVAGNGRLTAWRTPGGDAYFSTLGRERYVAGLWTERLGSANVHPFPPPGDAEGRHGMKCDELACLVSHPVIRKETAFIHQEMALLEDCQRADFLIAPNITVPPWRCTKPDIIIDRWAVRHNGGYALYVHGRFPWSTGMEVTNIRMEKGQRLWVRLPDLKPDG